MDVHNDKECFVSSDGSRFTAQVLIVNFKKLFTSTSPVKIPPELQVRGLGCDDFTVYSVRFVSTIKLFTSVTIVTASL